MAATPLSTQETGSEWTSIRRLRTWVESQLLRVHRGTPAPHGCVGDTGGGGWEWGDGVDVPDLFRWTDMVTHKNCLSPSAEAQPAFRPPLPPFPPPGARTKQAVSGQHGNNTEPPFHKEILLLCVFMINQTLITEGSFEPLL